MRLGLALPHYDTSLGGRPASWENLVQLAGLAESSGFDSLWVSDHLFLDWSKYGGPSTRQGSLECWTTLSALAMRTERVRLGSLTLCNDLRSPGLLAKMAATLDRLSGGRLDLGLGAGWYQPEYHAVGIDLDRAGRRIERLAESAEIVGRLLDGEELNHEGRHYRLQGAICRPGPLQKPHPPIWIGGKGDRLLGVVARVADGWNFSWLGSLDTYRERLEVFRQRCDEAGRDESEITRSVGVYLLAGEDAHDAERRFERLRERTPAGVLGGGKDARPAVSWDEFRERSVAGSIDEVVDRLGRLGELGVSEVIVTLGALPFQVADLEDVELVGNRIAPQLG